MDQFDQYRDPRDARKRVRLYAERFLALAREGSEGEDDEQAPRIDVVDHVTLDVRDLLALTAEPDNRTLATQVIADVLRADVCVHGLAEAVAASLAARGLLCPVATN